MEHQVTQRQAQASFLDGDLTSEFLGQAGVESMGGVSSGEAQLRPTITGRCCYLSYRYCPSRRCTRYCHFTVLIFC